MGYDPLVVGGGITFIAMPSPRACLTSEFISVPPYGVEDGDFFLSSGDNSLSPINE